MAKASTPRSSAEGIEICIEIAAETSTKALAKNEPRGSCPGSINQQALFWGHSLYSL